MLALTHLSVTVQVILTLHAAAHSGSMSFYAQSSVDITPYLNGPGISPGHFQAPLVPHFSPSSVVLPSHS